MKIDIQNEYDYKEILYFIFTCYDIVILQKIKEDVYKTLCNSTIFNERIRLNRLYAIITNYIDILNKDLSNLN